MRNDGPRCGPYRKQPRPVKIPCMPNYRRARRPGGTFFFTLVTFSREPFLTSTLARECLRTSIEECRTRLPFEMDAFVLLPDHLHAIWTLPDGDDDFSTRWGIIKKSFTQRWLAQGGRDGRVTESRRTNRRKGVWQRRFWEQVIRDQDDLRKHLNYIHFNPVKHGHANCPHDWKWSSFHRWIKTGEYGSEWCCKCEDRVVTTPDFRGLDVTAME
jgi:putative transposase